LRAFLDAYYRLLKVLLTALIAILIVPVCMQIASRYTGIIPRFIWTEEIARFCFIWIILIGAMLAVRDGAHFDVDVLPHSANPMVELIFKLIVHAAMALVALTFLRYGWDFAVLASRQRSDILGLPMLFVYIAWPLAGASWVLFIGEKAWDDVQSYRRGAH
jgi:TRAP-type C4-dicarboxylate transport system permease small subunit